jgi:hypothetical protein
MVDVVRVVNVIPNSHSNETNQDSEPSIAVGSGDPSNVVITAFTPVDVGSTGGPTFWSNDGGQTWNLNFDIPGGASRDQTVAYAAGGSELYGATLRGDAPGTTTLAVFRTPDPTVTGVLTALDKRTNIDQPWIEARIVGSGNDVGKDRVYLGYNNDGASDRKSATVDTCLDARAANPAFTPVVLETRSVGSGLLDGYAIRPVSHADGTIYVAYERWTAGSFGSNITTDIIVARDDDWASGGSPFTALTDPSDNKPGRKVATGVVINDGGVIGQERLNNDLAIAVDPTNSNVVYIAWADNAGANYTIRVRRSLNRGVDWSGDLLTVDNATMACLSINTAGVVGLMYQQVVGSNWETHFRRTTDGTGLAWNDLTLNKSPSNQPVASFQPYLGDWARIVAVGRTFHGVFCANNTPDPANFPQGVTYARNRTTVAPFRLLGTDNTTTVAISIDPFYFQITEVLAGIITDRSTFGEDEINAMLHQGSPAVIPAAFYVTIDGFRAADINLTAADLSGVPTVSPTLAPVPGLNDMTIHIASCHASDPDNLALTQRFTFTYDVHFTGVTDFNAETRAVGLHASMTSTSGVTVTADAGIILNKQPNPFEIDGPTSWLSVDLQVFALIPGSALPSTPGIQLGTDPHDFLNRLLDKTPGSGGYNDPNRAPTPNHPYDLDLVAGGNSRQLELAHDIFGIPFFNFAVARVRYRALSTPAQTVRVFFRSFQAATTSTDFQPGSTYATGGSGGTKIPLLGIVNGEVVTIPFFAASRVADPTTQPLNTQTDPLNVADIPPDSSGAEVERYFGCWLDINQTTPVVPINTTSATGPFAASDLRSIQQAVMRAPHQCLVAEINFDGQPVSTGATPASSDKLAQRNLSILGAASPRSIPQPFDIRPRAASLAAEVLSPDELMIDWGNVPNGTTATVFVPGLDADAVLIRADALYDRHLLSRVDEHTIGVVADGISFIPVVHAVGANLAGLVTIELPASVTHGHTYHVVVRQLTLARAPLISPPPPPQLRGRRRTASAIAAASEKRLATFRRVVGSFQIDTPVTTKTALLGREERNLGVLRFIAEAITTANRWHPIFERYLPLVAGRVTALGGDPSKIPPSPSGLGEAHRHPPVTRKDIAHEGKISGLIFDAFGDFEGFVLNTGHGQYDYHSREPDWRTLAERCWRERLRLTVFSTHARPEQPVNAIVWEPPTTI